MFPEQPQKLPDLDELGGGGFLSLSRLAAASTSSLIVKIRARPSTLS
jgi:hypothetical protein